MFAWFRHPSYIGWFFWSCGTQVMLGNPVSVVAFFFAGSMFFKSRIPYEEDNLVEFFGNDYKEYCKRTPIWIPFVESEYKFVSYKKPK